MTDNDLVQGSWHGNRWVSADEKRGYGFNNYDQIHGNQSKMNTYFGPNEPNPFAPEEYKPVGPVPFNPKLFFGILAAGALAVYLAFNAFILK